MNTVVPTVSYSPYLKNYLCVYRNGMNGMKIELGGGRGYETKRNERKEKMKI